jgi:hypothetical protein
MTFTVSAISWQNLPARRTVHRLQPQMLENKGLIKILKFRPEPYSNDYPHSEYAVLFDRNYAVEKLAFEIHKLSEMPFVELVELLLEAYTVVNPTAPIIGTMPAIRNAVRVDELFRALGGERHYQEFGEVE